MRLSFIIFILFSFIHLQAQINLPVYDYSNEKNYNGDWLVSPVTIKAGVYKSADKKNIILYNGLVKRVFRV